MPTSTSVLVHNTNSTILSGMTIIPMSASPVLTISPTISSVNSSITTTMFSGTVTPTVLLSSAVTITITASTLISDFGTTVKDGSSLNSYSPSIPPTTSTYAADSDSGSNLSVGIIVGCVIGIILSAVFTLLVIILVYYCLKRKKAKFVISQGTYS